MSRKIHSCWLYTSDHNNCTKGSTLGNDDVVFTCLIIYTEVYIILFVAVTDINAHRSVNIDPLESTTQLVTFRTPCTNSQSQSLQL